MSLSLSNTEIPIEVANIEDEELKKQMRKWVQFYTQFARDLASLQSQAAKMGRTNRELNIEVGKQIGVRGLPREKLKGLQDLQRRTVAMSDLLAKLN